MTTNIETEDDLGREVARLAVRNGEQMRELSHKQKRKYVREAFRQHQVVWVMWIEADRVGIFCAKGINVLNSGAVLTTALPVADHATALSLAEKWGDGALHSVHEVPEQLH